MIESDLKYFHEQIADLYIKKIDNGELQPGESLPSEKKSGEFFFVSRNTIRKAYQILSDHGIIETKKGSGSRICIDAFSKINKHKLIDVKKISIGVILTEESYFGKTIKGMELQASKLNFELVFIFAKNNTQEREALHKMMMKKVDIMIITPIRNSIIKSTENYDFLMQSKIPFIMIGKPPLNVNCNSVYVDDFSSSMSAVEALFQAGCDNVLHISDYNLDSIAIYERAVGFNYGVKKIFRSTKNNNKIIFVSDKKFEEKLEKYIINTNGKLGIFLHDDEYYKNILGVIKDFNLKIGKDISIIGYGGDYLEKKLDTPLADLTTYLIPKKEMGIMAIELANRLLNQEHKFAVNHIILQSTLHIRKTL